MKMLHHAKFQVEETFWSDLIADEAKIDSPAWHEEALKKTECLVKTGKAEFLDWEVAQTLLRREVGKPE